MYLQSLTPKQKKVLEFIQSFINKNDYSPSLKEIAEKFNKSVPTIYQYVKTLKNKGFLDKKSNIARGISLQQEKNNIFLLGYIAAGNPIEPIENPEPIDVPKHMMSSIGNYYALKVKGNSMIDEGILNNDTIIIKHQNTAQNGDIVVAITENGATLKVFRNKNGRILLEPRNKKLKNIHPKRLEIRGKFCGLIRE